MEARCGEESCFLACSCFFANVKAATLLRQTSSYGSRFQAGERAHRPAAHPKRVRITVQRGPDEKHLEPRRKECFIGSLSLARQTVSLPSLISNHGSRSLISKASVRHSDFRFGLSELCLGQIGDPA